MPENEEVKTAKNCHRLGHVDYQVGTSNLAKCKLCGRVIYRELKQRGVKSYNEGN